MKATPIQVSPYRTIKVPTITAKQARAKDKANAGDDTFFADLNPPKNTAYDALGAALKELSLPDAAALAEPAAAAPPPPPFNWHPYAIAAALALGLAWLYRR
jgi:MYXO-CTERM domain-containing protein